MKKIILTIAGVPVAIISLFFVWRALTHFAGAGSYPFVETYCFNVPESKLISAISKFKSEHPEYIVPETGLDDGRRDSTDYWYHVYIYYKEEDRIIYFWTRPEFDNGKDYTTLALVGVNKGLRLGNWYYVNSGYNYFKDRKIKKEFEQRVISELKKNLSQ